MFVTTICNWGPLGTYLVGRWTDRLRSMLCEFMRSMKEGRKELYRVHGTSIHDVWHHAHVRTNPVPTVGYMVKKTDTANLLLASKRKTWTQMYLLHTSTYIPPKTTHKTPMYYHPQHTEEWHAFRMAA